MSTLGLVAMVLAALVVAVVVAVWWTLRRRTSGEETGSPRTVADLVRMRAEQAADAAPAPDPVAAGVAAGAGATAVQEGAVESPVEPSVDVSTPDPAVVAPAAVEPARAETPPIPARVHAGTGSDTPWGRAARMTDGDGAVWATGDTDHEWSGWADWADVDDTGSGVPDPPEPRFRPVVLPAVSPDLFGTRTAPPPDPTGSDAPPPPVPDPTTEEAAVRARRTAAEAAAEQAAVDLALLRTFGCTTAESDVDSNVGDGDGATVSPAAIALLAPVPLEGPARPVTFRVVGRDGTGVGGAGVTLLDDHGRESAQAKADAQGGGEIRAPHPGSYVLVSAAPGHQPGAVAITVADAPVEAEVLLARSASVAGSVFGEDGPIIGARMTLMQDGEIVDTTGTGPDGEYWMADLAAGDYSLSVTAAECESVAILLTVPDETDLRHDVELVPAGLPAASADADADVMIGQL